MEALEALINTCQTDKVRLMAYIPPIRHDVEIPYIESEYVAFKERVEQLIEEGKNNGGAFSFYNFENVVPAEYWGVKQSTSLSKEKELDFMHFQYEGHKLLYYQLEKALRSHDL